MRHTDQTEDSRSIIIRGPYLTYVTYMTYLTS